MFIFSVLYLLKSVVVGFCFVICLINFCFHIYFHLPILLFHFISVLV